MDEQKPEGAPSGGEATAQSTAESTQALAERLYQEQGAEEQAGEKRDGEGKDTQEKAAEEAAKEGVLEHYDLRLPDGVIVNAEMRGEFETLARENRLSTEAAQRFADMHLKSVGEAVREWTAMGEKRFEEVKGWATEFDRDPYFGGAKKAETVQAAQRVLNTFGTPEEVARLKAELNKTGLGDFPVLVRGLARLARLLGDKLPANQPTDRAHRLYPNLK